MEIFILKHYNLKNPYIILKYIYKLKFNKNLNDDNILKNENGKPFLKNNEFFFNISHSKNYTCIGISNYKVGVDIEENRKIKLNSINKFLTPKEISSSISPLEYWVIKEAYSKYLGFGLKMNFKEINIEKIKKSTYLAKVSNENFICYCISKSPLKNITYLNNYFIK